MRAIEGVNALTLGGIVAFVVGAFLLFTGVKKLGGLQTILLGVAEIALALGAAMIFLGESLSALQWVGAGFMLGSMFLMRTDAETPNPSYRTGSIALSVEPVSRRLEVTITPSATRAQPGETVTLDIKAVDAHGEPVSAEVGVTVTDLAILSLMPPNSPSLEEQFYGSQAITCIRKSRCVPCSMC